jgi:hypothetical protein
MREIRLSGSEGGARSIPCPYPYQKLVGRVSSRGATYDVVFITWAHAG